jgi:hypothetical protein
MNFTRALFIGASLLPLHSIVSGTTLTNGLTFVAITPCRIIDTRSGQGFSGPFGPPSLAAGGVRTFQITGTTTGTPTQCGVPDDAEAISANFTATGFSGPGDLRAFPAGGSVPNASVVNYNLENIANMVTLPMGPSGSGHNGIAVRADVHGTDLVVDVNGYYSTKLLSVSVGSDGAFLQGVHANLSFHIKTGVYAVRFDRDVSACIWTATVAADYGGFLAPGFAFAFPLSGYNDALTVKTTDTGGGLDDRSFIVTVICP